MLEHTPFTDPPTITPEVPASSGPQGGSRLRLRMNFATPHLAVLAAAGDLDAETAPRFAEMLSARLLTKLDAIVVDLGELDFLGVAGLELLCGAHTYAGHRGIDFGVVSGSRDVERALEVAGLTYFGDIGRAREGLAAQPAPALGTLAAPAAR